jgi:Uma2 family endonuclease
VSAAAEPFISRDEYLSLERDGIVRHEWVGGQMWMMTGGTGIHNRISVRLLSLILAAAERDGCRTYVADMKVLTDSAGYYPDVMVVCDDNAPGEYHEEHPCLIAEVLSKTTGDRDRREKWVSYKSIDSLQHYLLISQIDTTIEHRYRTDHGWSTEVLGPDDTLTLQCPSVAITVSSLYAGLVEPLN